MAARLQASSCAIVGLGVAALLTLHEGLEATPTSLRAPLEREAPSGSASNSAQAGELEPASDALQGIWTRYVSGEEGSPVAFWYFHGDGKGLYRYGRVGLTNTHSFDYELSGAGSRLDLNLRFRKTGEAHAISALVERDERGRAWMVLRGDPRGPGARYQRVSELGEGQELGEDADGELEATRAALGDRLWIDYGNYATGGAGFHMYQFARSSLDGRGIGWFHRGDFDEWSTESLTYRISGDHLELYFDLREEPTRTRFRLTQGEQGRELWLDADPRDYWAPHRYRDGGKSFDSTSAAFDAILGLGETSPPR